MVVFVTICSRGPKARRAKAGYFQRSWRSLRHRRPDSRQIPPLDLGGRHIRSGHWIHNFFCLPFHSHQLLLIAIIAWLEDNLYGSCGEKWFKWLDLTSQVHQRTTRLLWTVWDTPRYLILLLLEVRPYCLGRRRVVTRKLSAICWPLELTVGKTPNFIILIKTFLNA